MQVIVWAITRASTWNCMGFMLFSDKGMARIRIVMAITLDGFLPKQEEKFMQWLMEEPRKGFPYWKEKASFQINELYGIIDLSCLTWYVDLARIVYARLSYMIKIVQIMPMVFSDIILLTKWFFTRYRYPTGKDFHWWIVSVNIIGNSALSNCTPMAFPVWCTKKDVCNNPCRNLLLYLFIDWCTTYS